MGINGCPQMLLRVAWAQVNAEPLPATLRRLVTDLSSKRRGNYVVHNFVLVIVSRRRVRLVRIGIWTISTLPHRGEPGPARPVPAITLTRRTGTSRLTASSTAHSAAWIAA